MPRISVVVSVHNVDTYLGGCLESLTQQTTRDLEVIIVDDGSSDSSAGIAAGFAQQDPRFRLVQQPNGGLARARNTGTEHCDGEFLMFVDGDDVVPRGAIEALHTSLQSTGSDFATGNIHQFTSFGTSQHSPVAAAFRSDRSRTHVRDVPALLSDRSAPNKLWRRSFWEHYGLRFPEDVLDEDIHVVSPAHIWARKVDVIADPVYLWRVRQGEDRTTTRVPADEKAFRDRVLAVDTVSRLLASQRERSLKRLHDRLCAAEDFRDTLQELDTASDDFRALFLDVANDFFDRAHAKTFDTLPAIDRLKWHLVRHRQLPELLEALKFEKTGEINRTRVLRRRRRFYADYPYRKDRELRVPKSVYRLDQELSLRSRIDDLRWEGDTLWIEGFAHINFVDAAEPGEVRTRLRLQRPAGGHAIDLPVEQTYRPDVTATSRDGVHCYDWSGFRTRVNAADLRTPSGWKDRIWRLEVTLRAPGVTRRQRVRRTAPGRAQRPEHLILDDVRIVPTTSAGKFAIAVDTMRARVRTARVEHDVLQLEGTIRVDVVHAPTARLHLARESGTARLDYPVAFSHDPGGETSFVARVPLGDLVRALDVGDRAAHSEGQGDGVVWQLALQPTANAEPQRLKSSDLVTRPWLVEDREVVLSRTRRGELDLVERDYRPEVMQSRWTDSNRLELEGRFLAPQGADYELVLSAQGRRAEHAWPMRREQQRFQVTLSPAAATTLAGTLPLPQDTWDLLVRRCGEPESTVRVKVDHALFAKLPLAHSVSAKRMALVDIDYDSLALEVGRDLLDDENGAYNQRRVQKVDFPAFLRQPVRDAVLFESYGALQYSDNPRAIYEELARRSGDLELLWSVADAQTELPEGLTPVRHRSRLWYEAMARSRYIVTCAYRPLEAWVTRRPDQIVVQTWHGPPFKRIGFDSQRIEAAYGRRYHERLTRETASWDFLVSPSPVASPILRSAFRFHGELLETGYPRTDIFYRPDREAVARDVRRRLGVPEGKKVVLYAPTFRDDQRYRRHHFKLDLRLDLDRARAALGDDYVLLVRRHTRVVDSVTQADQRFTLDVSLYPDVNELLVATDVLVTDYSSLMFDFANTGRPMVFFTYDLEDYRDRLRGFYFDIERVPGPLLRTSDEVIAALQDPQAVRRQHAATYEEFCRDFCAFDDGKAAARVVERVFGR